jgi:cobyrinic acid a,c-diamide synthase
VLCCADLNLCGVLLNKVGSTGHGLWLAEALTAAWQQQRLQKQIKVMGCIQKVNCRCWALPPSMTG